LLQKVYESGLRECYILNPSFKQYGLGCSCIRGVLRFGRPCDPPILFKKNIVMLHDKDEDLIDALKRSDESKDKLFESWIVDLVDPEDEGESCEDGCCGDNCES